MLWSGITGAQADLPWFRHLSERILLSFFFFQIYTLKIILRPKMGLTYVISVLN